MTTQPSWHCIANLGDINPETEGGQFLMVDKRGGYTPELWIFNLATWAAVDLIQCYEVKNEDFGFPAVSDNKYYMDKPSWFGSREQLLSVAKSHGSDLYDLKNKLCSACPALRAQGYIMLVNSYGVENFDSYSVVRTRAETKSLCKKLMRQAAQADKWRDGI